LDIDDFLAHYGVKGMRWGVRRGSGVGSAGSRARPGAHPDAVRAKEAKTKVKKGSTDALSTQELQALVTRMNLERQYSTLKAPTASQKGRKFLADVLVNTGKQQITRVANDQLNKQLVRMLSNARG
jgi:hypothetical protein